jgi:quinol monooxygenase YgiN
MPELRVVANYTVAPGNTAEVLELLKSYAPAVLAEEGNAGFTVNQDVDAPERLVLLERYVSREAFQAHRDSEHFTQIAAAKIIPLLADRVVELYDISE